MPSQPPDMGSRNQPRTVGAAKAAGRKRARLPEVDAARVAAYSPLRVLSLSGGGYRGLFSATVLTELCDQAGVAGPLDDRFQVFAGTSIGGLMACALAVGVPPRRIVDAIEAHGPGIFKPRSFARLRKIFAGEVYSRDALSAAVHDCLGPHAARPVADVDVGLVVPTVNWSTGAATVFTSGALGLAHASDATLHDVCMATAAAPTYFAPHDMQGSPMLDGGLVANNPDMLALGEVLRRWPDRAARIEMLSIGTAASVKVRTAAAASRGELGWARDITGFMIDVQEASAAAQAARLLGDRYLRINHLDGAGHPAFERMDATDDEARQALQRAGLQAARAAYAEHQAHIDRMLSALRAG